MARRFAVGDSLAPAPCAAKDALMLAASHAAGLESSASWAQQFGHSSSTAVTLGPDRPQDLRLEEFRDDADCSGK